MKTFQEYREFALGHAFYPNNGTGSLIYATLGLCGEAGEFAEKTKKMIRDDKGVLTEERRNLMKLELGDILWYLNTAAFELGFTLEEVAQANIEKLLSRKERGTLKGSGDQR